MFYAFFRLVDLGCEKNELELKTSVSIDELTPIVDETPALPNDCTLDSALKSMNFLAMNVTSAITKQPIELNTNDLQSKIFIYILYSKCAKSGIELLNFGHFLKIF